MSYDDFNPDMDVEADAETTSYKLLDEMNENQIKAISFKEGTALIVAGAGSGKTTVMTKRVAALINAGVFPESILLLTFTRMAANNMVDRAKKYTPYAEQVNSGTFHSIAHRLIRENVGLLNMEVTPSIIDPSDTTQTFKKIAKLIGGKDDNLPKGEIIAKAHSFASNTMRTLEDVVYDKYEKFSQHIEFMEECVTDYKKFKKERGLVDYDDLLIIWNKMLDDPSIAQQMQSRFKYIMIDEHQDSNALQCSIIEKIGGSNPNIMAVGDPAQAIYGFRGAAPRTMFAFKELWPQTETIYLNTNYRSTEEVLSIGNAIDESMSERFERRLEARADAYGELPQIVKVATPAIEANYMAEMILKHKDDGTPLSEQAVLVRSLHAARAIEFELTKKGIPYKVSGGIKVSEARHIKDFLSVVRCAVNKLDEPAWIRSLTMARKIGPAMGEKVFKIISQEDIENINAAVLQKTKNNEDIAKILDAWVALVKQEETPVRTLKASLAILDDIFTRNYQEDWDKRKKDIEAVVEMATQFSSLEDYLTAMTLDHSVEKTSDDIRDGYEGPPLTISTAHSAKGLEWDIVYIPSFNKGHFPSSFAHDHESIEEEKRVLYVAVTRPREKLIITTPTLDFQGNRYEQSQFDETIRELCESSAWGQSARPTGFSFSASEKFKIDIYDTQ